MKKFVLVVAMGLCGCAGVPSIGSAPKLSGYQYSFPIPNRDLPPGTVIIAWGDKIDIVCTPTDYGAESAMLTPNPPEIQASQSVTTSVRAQAEASVRRAIDAAVSGANISALNTVINWKPLKLQLPARAANSAMASPVCNENAKLYRASYGRRLKYFSIITDVASATFQHEAKIDRQLASRGGLADQLAEELDASVDIELSGSQDATLSISGNELYIQYNSDDRLLGSLGT